MWTLDRCEKDQRRANCKSPKRQFRLAVHFYGDENGQQVASGAAIWSRTAEVQVAHRPANRDKTARTKALYRAASWDELVRYNAAYRAARRLELAGYDAAYYAANRAKIFRGRVAYRTAQRWGIGQIQCGLPRGWPGRDCQ